MRSPESFEYFAAEIWPVSVQARTSAAVTPTTARTAVRRAPSSLGSTSSSTETASVTISAHCTALSVNERLRFDICAIARPSASEYGTFSSA